jgi:hypothetical protein
VIFFSKEEVVVENEDSLFEVIVGLGSDYYCLVDYLRFEYLTVSSISRFVEMIDISQLSSASGGFTLKNTHNTSPNDISSGMGQSGESNLLRFKLWSDNWFWS